MSERTVVVGTVNRTGWFVKGKMMNWDMSPAWVVKVMPDGKVLCNGVEIVAWTRAREKSLKVNDWVTVGPQ